MPYRAPRFVPSLDGLRCIGLFAVVFSHLPTTGVWLYDELWQINQTARLSYILLDSFFALSGFLITRLLIAERASAGRISLSRFYARRSLRILPIYYLTLFVCILVFRFSPAETAALATYTFNIYHPLVPIPNAMEQTWSLSVEEQFYLVWPLLMSVIPLRMGRLVTGWIIPALGLASALTIAVCLPLSDNVLAGNLIYMLPFTRMIALSFGAWVAFREFEQRPVSEPAMGGLAVISVLALVADKYSRDHGLIVSQGVYWSVALIAYSIISMTVLSALVFGTGRITRAMQAGLSWSPLRIVGRATYGGYLYHLPVLYWFGLNAAALDGASAPLSRVILACVVTIVITAISARFIEAPLLSLKNRIRRTDPQPLSQPAVSLAAAVVQES